MCKVVAWGKQLRWSFSKIVARKNDIEDEGPWKAFDFILASF